MPSAKVFFLVAAALFGLGAILLGGGQMLEAKPAAGPTAGRAGAAIQWVGQLSVMFGIGFFSMALYLAMRIVFEW